LARQAMIESPITGDTGNREFFLHSKVRANTPRAARGLGGPAPRQKLGASRAKSRDASERRERGGVPNAAPALGCLLGPRDKE
jgi:hypothetical protein